MAAVTAQCGPSRPFGLDPKTGKTRWRHVYPEESDSLAGILTTAGRLLFTGDPSGT